MPDAKSAKDAKKTYYVHTAIPLCWCAAIGFEAVIRNCVSRRRAAQWAAFAVFAACALAWMAGRLYLQIRTVRASPQTDSAVHRFDHWIDDRQSQVWVMA